MKNAILMFLIGITIIFAAPLILFAHCEIPCGIYDDRMRVQEIAEHITTIEKSIKQIIELGKAAPPDYNQLVRWITNKDDHATKLQNIVAQYFMTQRITPDQKQYVEKLTVLHKLLIVAMKSKQSTEAAHIENMRSLLKEFETLYFDKHTH